MPTNRPVNDEQLSKLLNQAEPPRSPQQLDERILQYAREQTADKKKSVNDRGSLPWFRQKWVPVAVTFSSAGFALAVTLQSFNPAQQERDFREELDSTFVGASDSVPMTTEVLSPEKQTAQPQAELQQDQSQQPSIASIAESLAEVSQEQKAEQEAQVQTSADSGAPNRRLSQATQATQATQERQERQAIQERPQVQAQDNSPRAPVELRNSAAGNTINSANSANAANSANGNYAAAPLSTALLDSVSSILINDQASQFAFISLLEEAMANESNESDSLAAVSDAAKRNAREPALELEQRATALQQAYRQISDASVLADLNRRYQQLKSDFNAFSLPDTVDGAMQLLQSIAIGSQRN